AQLGRRLQGQRGAGGHDPADEGAIDVEVEEVDLAWHEHGLDQEGVAQPLGVEGLGAGLIGQISALHRSHSFVETLAAGGWSLAGKDTRMGAACRRAKPARYLFQSSAVAKSRPFDQAPPA